MLNYDSQEGCREIYACCVSTAAVPCEVGRQGGGSVWESTEELSDEVAMAWP